MSPDSKQIGFRSRRDRQLSTMKPDIKESHKDVDLNILPGISLTERTVTAHPLECHSCRALVCCYCKGIGKHSSQHTFVLGAASSFFVQADILLPLSPRLAPNSDSTDLSLHTLGFQVCAHACLIFALETSRYFLVQITSGVFCLGIIKKLGDQSVCESVVYGGRKRTSSVVGDCVSVHRLNCRTGTCPRPIGRCGSL